MSDSTIKDIRKQVRNVTKELLPQALSQEMKKEVFNDVMTAVNMRLTAVETQIRETLEKLDKRSKDTLDYLVRQSSAPTVGKAE